MITREVPVEVPTPVPVYPPDALLADCEAPALPVDPPRWGEVLVYLSRYATALAKCQSQIESLQDWRYDDDSGS